MKPTLHLLMGLPGSGKTTLSKIIQDYTGAERVSSDETRLSVFPEPTFSQKEHDELYALLDHNVEHLLESGRDVIYDANLNRCKHREEKYVLAKKHRANVVLWWVQTDQDLAKKRRISEQDHTLIPSGESPEQLFDRISELIERPSKNEPYIAVDGTKITQDYVKVILSKENLLAE